MKKDKYCFKKSQAIMVLVFLLLGAMVFILLQPSRNKTILNTRAETPYLVGGVANSNGCFEYNNSSHCTQDCRKSHGNLFQCSGTTSLFCCPMKPDLIATQSPTLTPSPTPLEGFASKIKGFNLTNEQSELLKNAGFTPINFEPSELSKGEVLKFENLNDLTLLEKNKEGGIILSSFKGKIEFNVNTTMLSILSITPSYHYSYLVQVLYDVTVDKEYLISFYDSKSTTKYFNTFRNGSYYIDNIKPYIIDKKLLTNSAIYFPIATKFLACQNKSNNNADIKVSEGCMIFGYREVVNGYELEYFYLDLDSIK